MKLRTTLFVAFLIAGHALLAAAQDRMPMIPSDKQTDAQKKAVADYKALRGADLTGPPWSVLLRVPDHVMPALEIRLHYLNKSAVGPKLTEMAILTAARKWTNNWEWNAHSVAAANAGLSKDIIAAVQDGRRPERMADDRGAFSQLSRAGDARRALDDRRVGRRHLRRRAPEAVNA